LGGPLAHVDPIRPVAVEIAADSVVIVVRNQLAKPFDHGFRVRWKLPENLGRFGSDLRILVLAQLG